MATPDPVLSEASALIVTVPLNMLPFEGEEIDPPGAVLSIFTVTTLLSALIFPALSVTVSAVDETEDPSVLRT